MVRAKKQVVTSAFVPSKVRQITEMDATYRASRGLAELLNTLPTSEGEVMNSPALKAVIVARKQLAILLRLQARWLSERDRNALVHQLDWDESKRWEESLRTAVKRER